MRRTLVGAALPPTIVAVAVGPVLLWWSRLPEEIAVHWEASGQPDGHMSRVAGLSGPVALAVVGALVVVVGTRHAQSGAAVPAAALGAFFAGLFAAVSLATVLANRDARRWQDADLPAAAVVLIVLGAMASAAAVVTGLRPGWLRRLNREQQSSPSPSGERVAWTGSCQSGWMFSGVAAGLALAALAIARTGALLVALAPAAVGALLLLAFGSVRVVAGANGVRVAPGTGWPRLTIPLARIDRAEAIAINPLSWGGWGYRGSLRLFGRAAWVLRRGEGLRLDLNDGRTFAVTVDHADEAAAVVNEWLSRRPPPAGPIPRQ